MSFNDIVVMFRDFLWDYVLLFAFLGIGLFLTIRLGFPQFSRVIPALKRMVSDIINKVPAEPGAMTPFQSLATSVAAQVGTGNIVGVATALASGGPGAAFWMLVSGFLGMATIFIEATMAQVYRERDDNGELVGGPAYYIKNGLKQKWLAYIFAILSIVALGIVGVMVQANSIVVSMESAFGFNPLIVAGVLLLIVGWILVGGMNRIAKFSGIVVPIMASAYVLASIVILILNLDMLIPTLRLIIVGAFTPNAMAGGALGIGIKESVRFGLARGLFSNEAGMGSTPHSHAVAKTKHPAEQGFVAMIGVFICTFIICVSTVMINLLTGAMSEEVMLGWENAEAMKSYAQVMTQTAFYNQFGAIGEAFLSISLSSFALTTIVSWYFFAEANVKFIVKNQKVIHGFKVVALIAIALGYYAGSGIIWDLVDLTTGVMALPNIIALIFLSKKAAEVLKDYDEQINLDAEHIHWDYKYEDLE